VNAGDSPVVGITGASGLVGGVACDAFANAGYRVRRFVRRPGVDNEDRPYALESGAAARDLRGVDVLVHCAYDLAAVTRRDVWRINVVGTRRLLDAAIDAGVRRTILVSSMSAVLGTPQIYGRAKLTCETEAFTRGMVSARLGLVYGPRWGGMAGTLRRLAGLPVVPVVAGSAHQFTLHEDDLSRALLVLAEAPAVSSRPIGLAHPSPSTFEQILRSLAAARGTTPIFVPAPWRALYLALRAGEVARLPMPVRADSLLGLAHAANSVPGQREAEALGLTFRPFSVDNGLPAVT
jgi:nucleoside-diphosphate-sugar epimerase